jgi:hypothetical protein
MSYAVDTNVPVMIANLIIGLQGHKAYLACAACCTSSNDTYSYKHIILTCKVTI